MLHLMYLYKPTLKARRDLTRFWQWVSDRDKWFYGRLSMAQNKRWYIRTVGEDDYCLEHYVSFADSEALAEYCKSVVTLCESSEWGKRYIEQEDWWDILDYRLLTDAPLSVS
ncbi:hypothetical protein ABK905_13740 [Acerihabitans sp. KWT182]|uniref:Uncharacterized protein n=1 Tax=Acerihabitans sp. KWT182 TaxID=3157919 RepID=A0AAU7Q4N9_9GAMM